MCLITEYFSDLTKVTAKYYDRIKIRILRYLYSHIHCSIIHNSQKVETTLEKTMAPHSRTLAWKIPRTEEPGRLQSMGSLRVGHD